MTLESIAQTSDNLTLKLPTVAALSVPALPAGYRVGRQALTPRVGTRSCSGMKDDESSFTSRMGSKELYPKVGDAMN